MKNILILLPSLLLLINYSLLAQDRNFIDKILNEANENSQFEKCS